MLEKLLVFSLKIEDLTFLTLICLSTEGKVKNSSHLFRKLRFAKIRHIGDYFSDSGCKMEDRFTALQVAFCGLIRGESYFGFRLGFRIVLQPNEKVGRYGSVRL